MLVAPRQMRTSLEAIGLATKRRKGSIGGAGFGMLSLGISLGVVLVGGAIAGTVFLGGSSNSSDGLTGAGSPANRAYDIVAETTLGTAQSAVETAATTSGYGSIDAQSLEFDEPSLQFTSGASTSDTQVSVATGSAGSSATSLPSIGSVPGTPSAGGSVTLAAYSQSTSGTGSCLFVWMTPGATWFGAEADQTSCVAQVLASAPQPGTPSSSAIGWAETTFPNP
jgi:hypothetical protein